MLQHVTGIDESNRVVGKRKSASDVEQIIDLTLEIGVDIYKTLDVVRATTNLGAVGFSSRQLIMSAIDWSQRLRQRIEQRVISIFDILMNHDEVFPDSLISLSYKFTN